MKNPLTKWIEQAAIKALKEQDNALYRQMFQWINTGNPIWIGQNQQDYIDKGYGYNDLIYSIVKTKLDAASSIDWLLYKVVDEKALKQYKALTRKEHNLKQAIDLKRKALVEIESPLTETLINKPNRYQTLNEIVGEYFGWMDLMGNFYLYGNELAGRYMSVHVAPSHRTEIVAGTMFDPIAGYKLSDWFGTNIIEPAKMLHIKNWNPDYDTSGKQLYGMSPMQAASRVLTLDNYGIDTAATTFMNQGVRGIIHRATGAGTEGVNFTPEQAAAIKEKLQSDYENPDRAGGLAATNAPVGYTDIGKSPVDMGVMAQMNQNLQRLCNVFQVPVELFTPGTTFNNKSEARKNMITTGILPKMNIFRDKYNEWRVKPYGKELYIDYDLMSITELQDDLNKIVDMYSKMEWATDNEKREATNYGRYDHPLADTLFVSPNRIPIEMASFSTDMKEIDEQIKRLKI